MAPFLRIAFNSYELGSLQVEDEANQPFCAVKMKEALSTGRAAAQNLGWGCEAQQEGPGALLCSVEPLRCLLFLVLISLPSCGCRKAKAAGSQSLARLAPPGLGVSGFIGCSTYQFPRVHLCQVLCWALRTLSSSRTVQVLPSWGSQSGGELDMSPDYESCGKESQRGHHHGLGIGGLPGGGDTPPTTPLCFCSPLRSQLTVRSSRKPSLTLRLGQAT